MHLPPSADALAALDDKHPISFPRSNKKAYADWHRLLRTTVPRPSQVRAMDQETVSRLLELIQKHFLVREKDLSTTISTWIWALFSRLEDVGTMNNDQVWFLREFGKKAILVQLSFLEPEVAEALEEASLAESGHDEAEVTKKQTKKSKEASLEEPGADGSPDVDPTLRQNTLATLDTIIVLVGDVFGQRDLLEFRQPWSSNVRS